MSQVLINIDVPDLKAGERFYTEAFALRVGRRFGENFVELLGLPAPIYLLQKPAGSEPFAGASTGRSYTRHWSPVHLDIAVEDLEVAVIRARKAGAVAESGIREDSWGRIALFSDPFGNGFCLLQFTGRGYDEIADPA